MYQVHSESSATLFRELSSFRQRLAANAALRAENSTVFFQLLPRDAFESVQGGTPINPNGLTQVVAGAGDNVIPITFKVKIQTWMHNTNRTLPPEFVEQQFGVRCIQ